MSVNWTAQSFENYLYSVKSDFLIQLERKMETEKISRKEFAMRLGRTPGRVSQIFNGALENFSIEKILKYAEALEMQVSIVAYHNPNPTTRGPVPSGVFETCWERQGKPLDFFDLEEAQAQQAPEQVSNLTTTPISSERIQNVVDLSSWKSRMSGTDSVAHNAGSTTLARNRKVG